MVLSPLADLRGVPQRWAVHMCSCAWLFTRVFGMDKKINMWREELRKPWEKGREAELTLTSQPQLVIEGSVVSRRLPPTGEVFIKFLPNVQSHTRYYYCSYSNEISI